MKAKEKLMTYKEWESMNQPLIDCLEDLIVCLARGKKLEGLQEVNLKDILAKYPEQEVKSLASYSKNNEVKK